MVVYVEKNQSICFFSFFMIYLSRKERIMIKDIIFDFDGTLTKKGTNVWKRIWAKMGYDVDENSYYKSLFYKYNNKEITHQDWCDLTCAKFRDRGFTSRDLIEIADKVQLLSNVQDTVKKLHEQGCHLHIVSGNIAPVIYRVLGDSAKYFDSINANDMHFDENGIIDKIVGTKYDFEGKARFIENYIKIKRISPQDVLFIGNGGNDKWVYESGCKTLCINPDLDANSDDRQIWNNLVNEIEDYSVIADIVREM